MSYILDALKKSDQERQSRQSPTIQTVHRPGRVRRRPLIWFAVACLLAVGIGVAVALLVWVYHPPAVAVTTAVIESPATAGAQPAVAANNTATGEQSPTESGQPDAASEVIDDGAGAPTVAFSELPDNIRHEIPALTFSFHVYSETPSSRTIIINNRRVREGDGVLRNLQLIEITPDGVVLAWKGRRFYINVVDNW